MNPFVFRLERFLRLRVHAERERAESLGAAVKAEEESRREAEARSDRVKAIVERASQELDALATVGVLRNRGLVLEAAVSQAVTAEDSHRDAQKTTDAERELWNKARVERRMIERLRARRKDEWAARAAKAEQRDTDETAARVHPLRGFGT
jgi:flagellar export protein FliJ